MGHGSGDPFERESFLFGTEIEQHVAAQDDVEITRMRRRLEQIVNLEAYRLAQRFDRTPSVSDLFEPFDHLVDAEATLNLELGEDAAACPFDARRRDVGAEDVDGPSAPLLRRL